MNIQIISLDRINPAAYNRVDLQIGDPEYEKLRRSIETFGYVEPIVWNERTGNMVGGHQRYKILHARGDTEAAVSVVYLDEQQERLLNLALNKVSGRWDGQVVGGTRRSRRLNGPLRIRGRGDRGPDRHAAA